ncbi:MAG TPA: hypothetical protein VKN99_18085 [Polyangia bacterium]|nr:hypothetical protein [Polyangia bacterium]
MTPLAVPALSDNELQAEASADNAHIRVRLAGTADVRVVAPLSSFFSSLHTEAERLATREVVVDLRALEFMNSACFKTFVTWLSRVQRMSPPAQYGIRFLANPSRRWQVRSLTALTWFAADLVTVEA